MSCTSAKRASTSPRRSLSWMSSELTASAGQMSFDASWTVASHGRRGRSQRTVPVSTLTSRPNLSVQESRICPLSPLLPGATVKMKAPPSVEEPPRAFQYLSATGQKRGSSSARLRSVASMACFSEQIRPICTSPLSESAKTCGRSMAVSVMPSSWNRSPWLRAMMKNHGPSGDAWMWVAWICR